MLYEDGAQVAEANEKLHFGSRGTNHRCLSFLHFSSPSQPRVSLNNNIPIPTNQTWPPMSIALAGFYVQT
ncbi:hypothetical protein BC830DRAFT_1114766 [Chytriomyces sp. MP71]|nr:hypothetical protein BC830DRAFT_1114766 [Chytriomyces sp. MP71]